MIKISTLKTLAFALCFVFATTTAKAQISFSTNLSVVCAATPTTYVIAQLTATNSSATSYSWSILPTFCGSFVTASAGTATFNISCGGVYTITCQGLNSSNVVVATATSVVLATSNFSLATYASPSVICSGGTSTIIAGGANSFTWTPGNFTGSSIVVSPSVSTQYTLTGEDLLTGCTGTTSQVVLVNPSPTVTLTSTHDSLCVGQSATLAAAGAISYTWNIGAMGSQQIVTPLSNTCFSVMGMNSIGCTHLVGHCIKVQSGPTLIITGANTVCLGSSATYTATGGLTYTWSNSSTASTVNILPSTTGIVSVTSTDANGCVSSMSTNLFVDTNCSDVWPGDANSDGNVTSADVFEIGLAFNSTGTARSPGGNTYVAQYATNWSGTGSTSKNLCHADCNGDGTINHADTIAVFTNFGLPHAFKPGGSSANSDISLVAPPVAFVGLWNVADVVLGSSSSNIGQLYGVSFDLDFDVNLIDDAYLVYTPSFLSASNQNIEFRKNFISNGKVVGVSVRTDKSNVSGNGKIAELHYKVKSGLAENTQLDFAVSNSQKIGKDGVIATLVPGTLMQQATTNLVGLNKQAGAINVQVFPNPSSRNLFIKVASNEQTHYLMNDLSGRTVQSGSFTAETSIDVSDLSTGVYFIEVKTAAGAFTRKVIVDHK